MRKTFKSVKIVLIIISLILIAALVIIPNISKETIVLEKGDRRIEFKIDTITANGTTASDIKYIGKDKQNRTYELAATQAIEQDEIYILLKDAVLDIKMGKNNQRYQVNAKDATVNKEKQTAVLKTNVVFKDMNDLTLKTQIAYVDMNKGIAYNNHPVFVKNKNTRIEAIGFTLDKETGKIKFKGRPKITTVKPQQ